jgi:transposase
VSLELTDAGFDFTLLPDFRARLLVHEAAQRLLDTLLIACKAQGWIQGRGPQRTASPHVLAAARTLHRLEGVREARPQALNQLRAADSTWVQQHVPLAWDTRDGRRANPARLPKEASTREALARHIGAEGYLLRAWVRRSERPPGLRALPGIEALRRIWLPQSYRRTGPGREELRWRTRDEHTARGVAHPRARRSGGPLSS